MSKLNQRQKTEKLHNKIDKKSIRKYGCLMSNAEQWISELNTSNGRSNE